MKILGHAGNCLPLFQTAAQVHVGDEEALEMAVLGGGDVVHDEPGPHVEVAVVDALQDQPHERKAEEDQGEGHLEFWRITLDLVT